MFFWSSGAGNERDESVWPDLWRAKITWPARFPKRRWVCAFLRILLRAKAMIDKNGGAARGCAHSAMRGLRRFDSKHSSEFSNDEISRTGAERNLFPQQMIKKSANTAKRAIYAGYCRFSFKLKCLNIALRAPTPPPSTLKICREWWEGVKNDAKRHPEGKARRIYTNNMKTNIITNTTLKP